MIEIMKKLALQALTASVSLSLSLLVFEAILVLALPDKDQTRETQIPTLEPSQAGQAVVSEAPPPSVDVQDRKTVGCSSNYYAVFKVNSIKTCVQHPVPHMTHWGPPPEAWFRSSGGVFEAVRSEAASTALCACLAEQNGYKREGSTLWPVPVGHIDYEQNRRSIEKWVCGDPCLTMAKGGKYEY